MSVEVLDIIVNTTRSVFLGLVGTAAAQPSRRSSDS